MAAASEIFIVGAKRTAIGKYGGKLAAVSATRMATDSTKAALADAKISPEAVDAVFVGNVIQSSGGDSIYLARHVALGAGIPVAKPALLVNRLCGSGFESVVQAYKAIAMGEGRIMVAGGVESMSQAPFVVRNLRFGAPLGQPMKLEDVMWDSLTDTMAKTSMARTAENLAVKYGITRQECEQYAFESHQRWAAAQKAGLFKAEIVPVTVKNRKKEEVFEVDEHPRPETTLEQFAKLPGSFEKDGTVTAGTASGINDGAGTLVLASAEAVKDHRLTPLARVVAYHVVGVQPDIMGIGPVDAIKGALKKAGLGIHDMDLVEINEAFAPQVLACNRELGVDPAKLNSHGGAVAVGHPLAASGSRIMAHLAHALHRAQAKYAVGSACIGGGQGIAIIVERC